jgi:CRP-like cAMP-binding protein
VRAAIHEAIANSPLAMKAPEPQVLVKAFGASSVDYVAYFWIEDYALDREARDQLRTNIWYTFRRRNIEIPWPIQIEYSREETPVRTDRDVEYAAARLAEVDLFGTLGAESRAALAKASDDHLYAPGEAIVKQDEAGDSMFVILAGRARVVLEPSGQEVAVIPAGGFFGEMSMLTGDRRTATVRAIDDVRVLEVKAADFRELALANPGLLDHISTVISTRRTGLEGAKAAAIAAAVPEAKQTFLARMRRFLTLHA